MGNARQRGTYDQRRRQALAAGRVKHDTPRESVKMPSLGDLIREATFARFPLLAAKFRKVPVTGSLFAKALDRYRAMQAARKTA